MPASLENPTVARGLEKISLHPNPKEGIVVSLREALSIYWETYMWDRKQQLELDMEQLIGSKLGKEYNKVVYCLPAYLTYMQNTSWERLDWRNPKPELRLPEKYQQPQICRWYHSDGRKGGGIKEPLNEGERGEHKKWSEVQHQKNKNKNKTLRSWPLVPSPPGK